MAVVAQFKSSIPSIFPTAAAPEAAPVGYHPRDVEAPEARDAEAPEARDAEAPDAGEGRAGHLEHEFTHGRSQG